MATPSVAMIPTGFKEGKLYSVLPEDGSGDFEFTRASAATRVNEDGLIQTESIDSSELILNGTFQNDDDWINEQNTWTLGNGRAIGNGANGGAEELQQSVLTIGKTYKYSFEVENYVSGAIVLFGTGTAILANGVYEGRYTAFTDKVSFRGVNFFGDITNVEVFESDVDDIPRLDYTDGGCPVLLTEPQSTNEIEYSEAFTNPYWTKDGATIQGNPATAGAEQVTNGDFATDSDWALGDTWSIGSGAVSATGNSTNQDLTQSNLTVGVTYLISLDIVSSTLSAQAFRVYAGGVFTDFVLKGTSETITTTLTATSGVLDLRVISTNSSGLIVIDNVSVKEVQGFQSPSADSPLNAFKLVENASSGEHQVFSAPVSGNDDYSISVFAKKAERTKFRINIGNDTHYVDFDLELGTVIATVGATTVGKIEALKNDWYRCSLSFTESNGSPIYNLIRLLDETGTSSYTGDGTSGVYIFGAQIEELSYTTSYIPTDGGSATRAAESCFGSGDASDFNDSEGVLFFEGSRLNNGTNSEAISISDGSADNFVTIQFTNAATKDMEFFVRGNAGAYNVIDASAVVTNTLKVALSWDSSNMSVWLNGVNVDSISITNPPTGLNVLNLGSNPFFGKTSQVQVFKTALSDSELQTLTTL